MMYFRWVSKINIGEHVFDELSIVIYSHNFHRFLLFEIKSELHRFNLKQEKKRPEDSIYQKIIRHTYL